MIRIGICDDNSQELEFAEDLIKKYNEESPQYDIIVHRFSTSLDMLSYVEEHGGFDVLFLDVFMPGMLGTDAARELRQLGEQSEIIFITSSRDHSLDAFEVDASQYLIKPYSKSEIYLALDKVMRRINKDRREIITLKTLDGYTRVSPREVVFTQTERNNYQSIYTIQGKRLEVRMTTLKLFELFSNNKYMIRCGVSLNVNLKYIRQISKDSITFDTGQTISYPYRAYSKLKEDFLSFQLYPED